MVPLEREDSVAAETVEDSEGEMGVVKVESWVTVEVYLEAD